MIDEIRNILDPGSAYSEEYVLELLQYARKFKGGDVWDAFVFIRQHGKLQDALDWLRTRGNKRLGQLADVLPKYLEELERKPAMPLVSINKNEQGVKQEYQAQSNAQVINL